MGRGFERKVWEERKEPPKVLPNDGPLSSQRLRDEIWDRNKQIAELKNIIATLEEELALYRMAED